MQKSSPVRLKDIAAKAGVHEATVSAVLSGTGRSGTRVSAKTAEKIRRIASEHRYVPNRFAQMMRTKRSGIIGLLECGFSEFSIKRTISAGQAVREMGFELLASNVLWYPEGVRKAISAMLAMNVEGIILTSPSEWLPPDIIEMLHSRGTPMVSFHGVHLPGIPQVRQDVIQAVQDITTHLISLERRRLAFLSRWSSLDHSEVFSWPVLERKQGFENALATAGGKIVALFTPRLETPGKPEGIPEGILKIQETTGMIDDQIELGFHAAGSVLALDPPPDALVCSNDEWAVGAIAACGEKGLRVPEDVAVTGIGNLSVTRFVKPPLTTADFASEEAGKVVASTLAQLIQNRSHVPPDFLQKLPCRLVIRKSCGSKGQEMTGRIAAEMPSAMDANPESPIWSKSSVRSESPESSAAPSSKQTLPCPASTIA